VRARLPYVVSVGLCVVLEEWVRTWWMGGMPWPARSLSFAPDAWLLSGTFGSFTLLPAASVLGAYALSFLAGMTSAWASGWPMLWRRPEMRRDLLRQLGVTALVPLLFGALLLYWAGDRRNEYEARTHAVQAGVRAFETSEQILLVQGNVPQTLKHGKEEGLAEMLIDRHIALSKLGIAKVGETDVAAILWPETMVPVPFLDAELGARFPEMWWRSVGTLQRIREQAPEGLRARWLIGALYYYRRGDELHERLNEYGMRDSLFQMRLQFVPPPGEEPPAPDVENPHWFPPWQEGRHDKVVLVPGGEYTPFGDTLPFLRWFRNFVSAAIPELDPGDPDQKPMLLWEGDRWSRMLGRGVTEEVRGGTVVCFEIAFPERCRACREQGATVLLNTANYGWFGKTSFRAQIRSIARLRAAELGMAVAIAGNTGPTMLIDPLGRGHGTFHPASGGPSLPAGGDGTSHQEGVVTGPLRVDPLPTPYTGRGPWPWLVSGGLWLLGGLVLGRRRGKTRSQASSGVASPSETDG
jgi:apolipoprotein N-acyltransferase